MTAEEGAGAARGPGGDPIGEELVASVVLRMQRELRSATERLRTIIGESPIPTVVLDRDRRIATWNRAAEELTGWRATEVIGTLLPTTPHELTDEAARLEERVMGGEVVRALESRLIARDGHEVPVVVFAAPVRQDSTIEGIVLRWIDLTERRRLELQLLQSQRLESVGRLAGGIAHDFNNVLTAILGYARLIADDLAPDDPHLTDLRAIEEAAERAAGLVRQLLAFGRQQVLRPEVLDLGEVTRTLAPMLRRLIGEDVTVLVDSAPGLWPIEADRTQLEQVLMNLAVNARDAMPRGGRITIEARNVELDEGYSELHPEVTPGPHVVLAVSDTGSGIPTDVLPHIFEPFFTTKEPGRGTGLGLATVYGIVRQSGGHIWVYSESGKGAAFRLYFPRTAALREEPGAGRRSRAPAAGTETVLVAEDEALLRDLIATMLTRLGYRVLLAADAAEALSLARTHPVDLLVSDVVMPGESGFELATAIGAIRPEMNVLLMSGYTAAALEAHGFDYQIELLQKPFSPETLGEAVRRALATRDAETSGAPG